MFNEADPETLAMFKALDSSDQAMVLLLSEMAVKDENFNPYRAMNKYLALRKMLELEVSERMN